MIIDTHCHIYESEIENAEGIIAEAAEKGISMILNGTDTSSNREVLELSADHDNAYAALGYFHTCAGEVTDDDMALLERQLKCDKVVAVGEIGLDYYHTRDNRDKQKELFEEMLFLAEKHGLPVIVHSRKAMQDTFDILKRHDVVGSMHSYQGSVEMARQFIGLGFYIGIGGTVTHPNNRKARKVLNAVGINNIVVETDSPYMAPQEKRGQKNTPLNIIHVIRKIGEELEMGEDEVCTRTSDNARKLFSIDG